MALLFTLPKQVPFTNAGALIPGAKAYFYINGTSTPQATYTDATLVTPHTNPVIADSSGRFPGIWLDESLSYKVKITDAADVEIPIGADDLTTALTADEIADALTGANVGAALYPITDAETSAGVTPTNYSYPPLDLLRYGDADITGVTDSLPIFKIADLAAAAANGVVKIPPGTYKWTGDFNTETITASWRGYGNVTINCTPTSTESRALLCESIPNTAEDLTATQTTGATRVAINEQGAGLSQVTCTTASDASNYAEGDYVHVAGGQNPFDADDDLWRYDQVFMVTNSDAGTGVVSLSGVIDMDLDDDDWTPGAGKNLASIWANSTAYTAGDYVRSGSTTGAVYKALTSSTSSGSSPEDDTGVSWEQVSNSTTNASEDFRPVIQKLTTTRANLSWSGFTVNFISECVSAFEHRSVVDSVLMDIDVKGKVAIPFYPRNGSRNILNTNVNSLGPGGLVGATGYNSVNTFNARDIRYEGCTLLGGRKIAATRHENIRIESFAKVSFDSACVIASVDGRTDSYGIFLDSGELALNNSTVSGFDTPIRKNTAWDGKKFNLDESNLYIDKVLSCTGNHFVMKSSKVRALNKVSSVFNATNTYEFYDNYAVTWNQEAFISFKPSRSVALRFSWTPATAQTNTQVELDNFMDGLLTHKDNKILVLGAKALWTTPTSDAIDIRFEVYNGAAARGIFTAAADTSSRIQLDDGTAFAASGSIWGSLGTGHRLVDPASSEYLRLSYYSGATAGGTVDVVLYALVEDGVKTE